MIGVFERIGILEESYEYSSFVTWEADTQGDNSVFHIGVLGQNEEIKNQYIDYKRHRFYEAHGCDYLLITQSGTIISSYVNGYLKDYYGDINTAFSISNSDPVAYIQKAKSFLGEKFGVDVRDEVEIYRNPVSEFTHATDILLKNYEEIDRCLIERLSKNPELLHKLHWRQFEELLAEVFYKFGYETEIGPGVGDEGVDLRLIKHNEMGPLLILVQAKKYAARKKIGLQPVQALYGAINDEKASKGILVSTCEFAPVAKRFESKNPYRIKLAGPNELEGWLKKYCET